MKTKFIFIVSQNLTSMNIFNDLQEEKDVIVRTVNSKYIDKILYRFVSKLIRHINFFNPSIRLLNKIFDYQFKKGVEYFLIIDSGVMHTYSIDFLNAVKKRENFHLLLLLFNSMNASSPSITHFKKEILSDIWEEVFTYDREDSIKYGWNYFGLSYFSQPTDFKIKDKSSDAYFIGGLKGNRNDLILDTFLKLDSFGAQVIFDIYCYSDEQYNQRKYPEKINYFKKWKEYNEIQKEIASTNCIIEILQDGQTTQSIRYFEAIYYNKKLLTNNPNIFKLPFYDERYMKFFNKVDDIDVEWVKAKESIDYGYNGEFSPIGLLQEIKKVVLD